MRGIPLLALFALSLAGCSGGGEAAEGQEPGGAHAEHGGVAPIEAPAWQVGQWWTLSSEQAAAPFTHAVSGDSGGDWTVDTDSADVAFFDARSDISFLGPVRKSDLAGSQGADRVEFFRFPLTLDQTWTTPWDGLDIAITVAAIEDGRATLEARHANGTLFADYVYDAALGYFREYTFYAPDGETVGFAARVTQSGQGFPGDLVRWALDTKYEHHGDLVPGLQGFDLDAGITDVWIDLHVACAQGGFSVTVGPPTAAQSQRGFAANGPCPARVDQTAAVAPPAEDNEPWGVAVGSVPQATQATLDLTVIARTAAVFKAGAAP